MDIIKLLGELSNAFGPCGFEDDVLEILRNNAPNSAILQADSLRNLYMARPQDCQENKPIVMLDAHTDEVGFMVKAIKPNGLLQMLALGGWVGASVPAHKVLVKNRNGKFCTGVVAAKPPHGLTRAEEKSPLTISEMSIDLGAINHKEVDELFGVEIGAPVAPDTVFEYNAASGVMMGKAFDNRAGCALVLKIMEDIFLKNLEISPVAAFAAQEEMGLRGAKVCAEKVRPNAAIVFEACPADDSFADGWQSQIALKKGPMLRHLDGNMIANPRFLRFALDIAEKSGIPVQRAVRESGGTNAGAIHLSGKGVPCLVISVPVRYIHSHYGYAALEDLENCAKLGTNIIENLTQDIISGF